ncbi:MAG TPA: GNAT family N-acetyltransferase [Solirubrobacteraceae bacterium]|nr:GNAT family N-acetyltransferase [Solirubrobacteraceae bacterium]
MSEHEGTVTIRELGEPGDLGWVVMAHGELYVNEFGWDTTFETLCARIVADYAADVQDGVPGTGAWVAELDGERVGCVFVVRGEDPGVAKLRILLVDQRARGRHLGHRLVATALDFATVAGYDRMQLWTNHPLAAARHVYLEHGFSLVREEPHHSFGVDLIGQTYELELRRRAGLDSGAGASRAGQGSAG